MQINKSIRIVGLVVLVLLGFNAFSQHNTKSPYSRFGVGDIVTSGKGRSIGMGGAGIALNSPMMLNSLNPASYGRLDSMSFIFEVGVSLNAYNFKVGEIKHSEQDANFDYFAMAFPLNNWWKVSLGVNPYSNVGYSTKSVNSNYVNLLYGTGGLNKAYLSQTFIPLKNLYLGVNASYMFGQIKRYSTVDFASANVLNFKRREILSFRDLILDFGFQYSKSITDNYTLSIGGVYTPKRGSSFEYSLESGSVSEKRDIDFNYASRYGGGLGLMYKDKLTIGIDYLKENWSETKLFDEEYKNSETYSLGVEFIPNKRSLRSYLSVVSYRFGVHYADSYIKIGNESIKDYGLSIGFGFPLRRSATNLNVSFDFGRRGENTILEENYAKLSLSFSLFSVWFYKQKYE